MMLSRPRNIVMVCSVVVFCVAVMGCTSSDDGKTRELEGQLDMANQAGAEAQELIASLRLQIEELAQRADITPDAVAALQSQITALSGRADISPADLAALQSQVAALSARADITPQDLQDLQDQVQTLMGRADITPQALADLRGRVQELMGRPDITPQDLQELRDQVAELSGRADITDQDLEDLVEQLETLTSDLETAEAARMAAERGALADMQVGGVATASHVMAQKGWSGNQRGEPFSSDAATWWVGHRKDGAVFHAAPWINPNGELEFYADAGTFPGEGNEVQTTPVAVHPGRYIDTTKIGNEQPGVTTTVRALEDSRLGADWQGLQATKVYDGGGMLRVDFYTDADASDNLAQPNVRDDFQHEITLDDILPLPADRDYSFFNLPEEGLPGTLDNVAGHFTCAPGPPSGCDFGTTPIRDRYSPLTNDIIFTPDDGSPVTRITGNKPHRVAAADYLSFGNWRYIPEDWTEMHAYEVGLFATVGESFNAGNLMALSGTAEYAGGAVGIYSVNYDSDEFTANVELSADFGSDTDFGAINGRVFNIALESGNPSPLMEIELSSRRWNDESGVQNIFVRPTWDDSDVLYHGGVIEGQHPGPEGWWVDWGGMFGGNGDAATDHPSSFAGAFTATRRDDELHRAESIAGSFGAHRQ